MKDALCGKVVIQFQDGPCESEPADHRAEFLDALYVLGGAAERLVDLRRRLEGTLEPSKPETAKAPGLPPLLQVLNTTPDAMRKLAQQIDDETAAIRGMLRL